MESVYIETTIPSAYHERRPQPKLVARREWTREWWDQHRQRYDLVTGSMVFDELGQGDHPDKAEKIALLSGLEILAVSDSIADIAEVYVREFVMPKNPVTDAIHLALASHHKIDLLLTWNCAHLANANKAGHIRRVNNRLGIHVPMIVTPMELLGVGPND